MTVRVFLFGSGVTRLSWLAARRRPRLGWFRSLARASLLTLAISMLSGCLVDDPPPYVAPQQTPPRLNAHAAQPRPDQVIVANTNDTLTFQVPVTSEDAGESLTAQLLLDYNGGANASLVGVQTIAPSTANDTTGRQFNLSWQVLRVAPGCHRFTLRAAHSKNLPDANHLPLDPADLAEVYWFANIDADAANSDMLVKCP